ncbi:hypothetical protein PM082_019936 [Marasmius tenuissimus]|nr:hypothetical protein PM082_019936 [Marasmius tenuissimus]
MLLIRRLLILFLLASLYHSATSKNFTDCLVDLQHRLPPGSHGVVDNQGQPVDDPKTATAIPYITCLHECGSGAAIRPWLSVVQEFSAWLLPCLALLSQLPFGAHDRWDNLIAAILTVGSPALAAFSLAITVLNGRWSARLFGSYSYPNRRNAVRVLNSLQQSPLRIDPDRRLIASLVVLPENDKWWSELIAWQDHAHTWSISAASFIAWVVIAYALTIANSFTDDVMTKIDISGQPVGAIWLWLIAIVFLWLQISPKCDSAMVKKALDRANEIAHVAGTYDHNPVLASRLSGRRAIYLDTDRSQTLYADEHVSVPIYNYARLFTWTEAVQEMAACFCHAARRAKNFESVDSEMEWVEGSHLDSNTIRPENRRGTAVQVEEYCSSESQPKLPPEVLEHASGVWTRLVIASSAALGLQWGTTGAAFLTVYLSPTTGLGCRSTAYLLYASAATLVAVMLVLSSILTHYASACSSRDPFKPHLRPLKGRLLAWSAIFLRRSGKTLGFFNAIWLVMACIFQITGFFKRCYCDGSVPGRGADKAYMIVKPLDPDVKYMMAGWIGGVVLGIGTAVSFIVYMNLMIQNNNDD